jgi:hypothetical protein
VIFGKEEQFGAHCSNRPANRFSLVAAEFVNHLGHHLLNRTPHGGSLIPRLARFNVLWSLKPIHTFDAISSLAPSKG